MRASEVLRAKVGYCNTKATLFIALLRAAGVPARQHFVDLRNVLISDFLNIVLTLTLFVFTNFFFFQQIFDGTVGITTNISNSHSSTLGFAANDFDEVFSSFFGKWWQRNSNDLTRRIWIQTQVRIQDGFFDSFRHGFIERSDCQSA